MDMNENIIKQETKKIYNLNLEDTNNDFIATPTSLHPEKSEEGRQFAERLKEKNPDFLVVIAYGKIIPQTILDIPKIAPINIHGSILPKYRGASPIQSTLLNNNKET
jgi:methionyl-tRNA formyltransferase